MKLYEHPHSGNSHKVRLLLSMLDLPYESVHVELLEGSQYGEDFRSLSPRGEVPTLVDDGDVFWESQSILVYLAGRYDDEDQWFPARPRPRADVMKWLGLAGNEIQYGLFVARAIVAFGDHLDEIDVDYGQPENLEEAQRIGRKALDVLDSRLSEHEWLVREHPTVADLACFPYVALAPMGNVSLDPYPAVERWIGSVQSLPGYRSMPGIQPSD